MSERQKLLDAARTAVNLLDAAHSAVDLLTTVLGTEEENGCHDNLTEQHCDVTGMFRSLCHNIYTVLQSVVFLMRGVSDGGQGRTGNDIRFGNFDVTGPHNLWDKTYQSTLRPKIDQHSSQNMLWSFDGGRGCSVCSLAGVSVPNKLKGNVAKLFTRLF